MHKGRVEFQNDFESNFEENKCELLYEKHQMVVQIEELVQAICSCLKVQSQTEESNKTTSSKQNAKSQLVYEELMEIRKDLENERQLLASERHHVVVQAKSMIEAIQAFLSLTSHMQLSCLYTKFGGTFV